MYFWHGKDGEKFVHKNAGLPNKHKVQSSLLWRTVTAKQLQSLGAAQKCHLIFFSVKYSI